MPTVSWQRTLIITAAQLRERAALTDQRATEHEQAEAVSLHRQAQALREAAHLLDDAEALIGSALKPGS